MINIQSFQLNERLNKLEEPIRVIYISSYIPRKCGIATFTKDLTTAINNLNPEALSEIIAVNDKENEYENPWEVKFKIKQENLDDYLLCAHYINQSSADVVVLEHEFGLYGGKDGEHIIQLINSIHKPLVTCFHTILPDPDENKRSIMKTIIEKSSVLIAMSHSSKSSLVEQYDCPEDKAVVIHHGVYDFTFEETIHAKSRLNLGDDFMIMMSGLLSPGKGFEYAVEAMPSIIKNNSRVKLYIVGETHPSILQSGGEDYKDTLMEKINELGISENVVIVNKFLELSELIEYFKATDIYITPHLDPQQAASGTLAKAIGSGKVCISTPFNYAKEMLSEDAGILVPFRDSTSIATAVNSVVEDKNLYTKYRRNAYSLGKTMQWPRIAQRTLNLFRIVKENAE